MDMVDGVDAKIFRVPAFCSCRTPSRHEDKT
jgi:hypothetical protein